MLNLIAFVKKIFAWHMLSDFRLKSRLNEHSFFIRDCTDSSYYSFSSFGVFSGMEDFELVGDTKRLWGNYYQYKVRVVKVG